MSYMTGAVWAPGSAPREKTAASGDAGFCMPLSQAGAIAAPHDSPVTGSHRVPDLHALLHWSWAPTAQGFFSRRSS
jgi:hypothetical protein